MPLKENERIGLIVLAAIAAILIICRLRCKKSSSTGSTVQMRMRAAQRAQAPPARLQAVVNPLPPNGDGPRDMPHVEHHMGQAGMSSHSLGDRLMLGAELGSHAPRQMGSMIGGNYL